MRWMLGIGERERERERERESERERERERETQETLYCRRDLMMMFTKHGFSSKMIVTVCCSYGKYIDY